jgi:hypothetical protein
MADTVFVGDIVGSDRERLRQCSAVRKGRISIKILLRHLAFLVILLSTIRVSSEKKSFDQ